MTLFGTAGIRGPVSDVVTPSLALAVGQAVASESPAGDPDSSIVLGHDGRETSPALAAAMAAGLASGGAGVRRIGQIPTPTLAYASRARRGMMITASHNPPADNGIKCFADGVEYGRDAEAAIERAVGAIEADGNGDGTTSENGSPSENGTASETGDEDGSAIADWDRWGAIERESVLTEYREAVCAYVRAQFASRDSARESGSVDPNRPLAGVSIAVDCGTGVGGMATPQVLDRLGAQVSAINANVDGHFPARASKPTPESVSDLAAFLRNGEYDLGLAHDGDADRLVVLGPDGEIVHEDTVLAVVAAHYVETASATGVADPVVVTTPNASARIDELVAARGGRVERVRLGALHEGIARVESERDGHTADKSTTDESPSPTVVFAAEPWKHIHPAFGGWIDGVVSAAMVAALVAEAGDVETLREPVVERPYRKISVPCPDDAKADVMRTLTTELPDRFPTAVVDTDHGLRLDLDDGDWLLVRPSGTEPYVRLYAESEAVDDLVEEARDAVERAVTG